MKNGLRLIAIVATFLLACASPEQRTAKSTDSNKSDHSDTVGIDTNTRTNTSPSASSARTDTSNTTEQKATADPGL